MSGIWYGSLDMKNYYVLALLLAFPLTSQAAWWDVSSWFRPQSFEANAAQTLNISTTSEPTIVEKLVEVEKIVEKVVEKPVEKIVTKTVTVDNPELLVQINEWKQRYSDLEKKYNSLKIEVEDMKILVQDSQRSKPIPTPDTFKTACEGINDDISYKKYQATQISSTDTSNKLSVLLTDIKRLQDKYKVLCQ